MEMTEEERLSHFRFGFFYVNPDVCIRHNLLKYQDDRILVPKRFKWMGWTINFGTNKGKVVGYSLLVAAAAIIVYDVMNGGKAN